MQRDTTHEHARNTRLLRPVEAARGAARGACCLSCEQLYSIQSHYYHICCDAPGYSFRPGHVASPRLCAYRTTARAGSDQAAQQQRAAWGAQRRGGLGSVGSEHQTRARVCNGSWRGSCPSSARPSSARRKASYVCVSFIGGLIATWLSTCTPSHAYRYTCTASCTAEGHKATWPLTRFQTHGTSRAALVHTP